MPRVRLFANLREMAGASNVEVPGDTVGDVVAQLADQFGPEFDAAVSASRIWKNGAEATVEDVVGADDEVAVIPPVSGGSSALPVDQGYENIFLAAAVVVLLAANIYWTVAIFAAALVGVAAMWAVDLADHASRRDLVMESPPLLASIVVSVIATFQWGAPGLGLGAMLSLVVTVAWAVFRPAARDLTSIAATLLASIIAALAVGSILLTRVSTNGDEKVGGFLIMALVSTLVGLSVSRMRRQLVDQFMASALATVVAAMAVAYISDFDILQWFFVGLVVAIAFISGRGLGAAFRTGQVFLADRVGGSLAALDGPMLAAGIFVPFLRLIADGEVLASLPILSSL